MGIRTVAILSFAAWTLSASGAIKVQRAWREARNTRGNTNIVKQQPIDDASWIWCAGAPAVAASGGDFWEGERKGAPVKDSTVLVKLTCEFDAGEQPAPLLIDISADERFYFEIDGEFVARGPHRGTVENWMYETYRIEGLAKGRHTATAYVWTLGEGGPLAQLSHRGGFILKAGGEYDCKLTTGRAPWKAGRLDCMKSAGKANGVWGTGAQFEIRGRGPYCGETEMEDAATVRGGAGNADAGVGGRTKGWMLFPSQLPDQTETDFFRQPPPHGGLAAKTRAVTTNVEWRARHVYTLADTQSPWVEAFDAAILRGEPLTIPPNTRLQAAIDLGRYTCAYPLLETAGGTGAKISWTWDESARSSATKRKGDRDAIKGKYITGYGDTFLPDGQPGTFSAPWFRCGKWCKIDIVTKSEPLTIKTIKTIESRYPLECDGAFSSPQAPWLENIREICTRAMQMCSHEMLFDCPYYEQQMYPGDTRVQLLVTGAMTRDDRLIKRAIEIYDLATHDDGMCPMNWPTRGLQESFTYTLCYLCMYGDYAMRHTDRKWLRARIPGMRRTMAGAELYENADGLIVNAPGWNFMDWVEGWKRGTAPGTLPGNEPNAEVNLFWSLAMRSAATVERAFGNDLQAEYWERKRARLNESIVRTFWSDERALLADDAAKQHFSEHAQALAIVAGALPAGKEDAAFKGLAAGEDLARCSVYFSYYLFEAYFKRGRADLFMKRLDLWRSYLRKGLTTVLEEPETPRRESRSDCHAWGAHPLLFMQEGLAGVRPDAPFYGKVLVAPQNAGLEDIKASVPHPLGNIEVELHFGENGASGTIATPVEGRFEYNGETKELKRGVNHL